MQPEGVLLSSSLTSWINLFLYWCRSYRKKDTTSPLRWLVLKNLLFAPMLALLQNWTLFLTVSNLSSSHLISYFCLVDWANCQIFHLQSNSRSQRLDLTLFDKKSVVSSYILPCMLSWHVTILVECIWTLLCLRVFLMVGQNLDTTFWISSLTWRSFCCLFVSIRPGFCWNLTSWMLIHWNFNSFFKNRCFAGQYLLCYNHPCFDTKDYIWLYLAVSK